MHNSLRSLLAALLLAALLLSASCNTLTQAPPLLPDTTAAPETDPTPDTVVSDTVVSDTVASDTTEPTSDTTASPPTVTLPAQEVKIFSQNVLTSTVSEEVERYAPLMIATFLEHLPDSIGVQECGELWAEKFASELPQYGRIGIAYTGAETGRFATYIYYLKDKYNVVASGTFWLSTTPDLPSKYGDTVDINRTCTWAVFENKETGFRYVHFNTHLDRLDDAVNEIQVQMIQRQMLHFYEMGYPVFATGDFNMQPSSRSYARMLEDERIGDSRILAKKTMNVGTYANFGEVAESKRILIDYCFMTAGNMEIAEYKVLKDVFVSDHSGIFIHAKVEALPAQVEYAPSFSDSATLMLDAMTSATDLKLSFPRAETQDGMAAHAYRIKAVDSEGAVVWNTTVYGSTYTLEPPEALSLLLALVGVKGDCEISVTPTSLMGTAGTPLTRTVSAGSPFFTPIEEAHGDILNLSVQNGRVVDTSPNQYAISKVGQVTLSENAMHFSGNGNYRTPIITDQYGKLQDGFTIALTMTTGTDLTPECRYASNHHDGGFAISSSKGVLTFSMHNGSSYASLRVKIEVNTTYHVVGLYDGTNFYLYVNGNLAASAALGGEMKAPTKDSATYLCFGADSNASGSGEGGNGALTLYAVALYSKPLDEGMVRYLYQNSIAYK